MATDVQLRDAAAAELKLTTFGYINKKWTTPPAGSHWANALGLLAQIGAVPPPPPPPAGRFQEIVVWDNPTWTGVNPDYVSDWKLVKAALPNATSIITSADSIVVSGVKAAGGKCWVSIPSFTANADMVSYAVACVAVGNVTMLYPWDEPDSSAQTLALLDAKVKALHQACPGVPVATSGFDAQTLSALAPHVDHLVVDYYPFRTGNSLTGLQACMAAAQASGKPWSVALDAFTDGGAYLMPTAAQLQAEVDAVRASKAASVSIYGWGNCGSVDQLQNHPDLLVILSSLSAS